MHRAPAALRAELFGSSTWWQASKYRGVLNRRRFSSSSIRAAALSDLQLTAFMADTACRAGMATAAARSRLLRRGDDRLIVGTSCSRRRASNGLRASPRGLLAISTLDGRIGRHRPEKGAGAQLASSALIGWGIWRCRPHRDRGDQGEFRTLRSTSSIQTCGPSGTRRNVLLRIAAMPSSAASRRTAIARARRGEFTALRRRSP